MEEGKTEGTAWTTMILGALRSRCGGLSGMRRYWHGGRMWSAEGFNIGAVPRTSGEVDSLVGLHC